MLKKNEQDKIIRYFSDLQFRINIYDKAKKEMDTYLASSFNVFDYINPNENRLSDIMADFLNPKGSHGQKDTFLLEFLKIIDKENDFNLMDCKIAKEDSTTHILNNKRRMDITMNFQNLFEIGIENKPWANEQENQLQDYEKHLTKKYGDNFCIVYISGDGSEPQSLKLKRKKELTTEGKLIIITYRSEIKEWLLQCYKECKSEKIRIFINDFIQYIILNFDDIYENPGDV